MAVALIAALFWFTANQSFAGVPDRSPSTSQTVLPGNALENSPSLYLRGAADQPIRWQPWGERAFSLARRLGRPVLIDIGAGWCHWCHVMDETTYADPEVIRLVNRNFVPVKVDADERPDIDGYYQSTAARMFGVNGWPLTCFATPDGALFFAAGFIPAPAPQNTADTGSAAMAPLLRRVAEVYAKDKAKVEKEALSSVAMASIPPSRPVAAPGAEQKLLKQILDGLSASYSKENGGFEAGPGAQFYDFGAVRLALAHGFFGHPRFTAMAISTLSSLAAGGVYDQLGGGFHRYSTDPRWRVPHFEKMAYDQAMAIRAYADAYEVTGDARFARIIRSIAGYVNRSLLDPQAHAFYSHQDSDAFKGDDGSYYTWTPDEVRRALGATEAKAALLYFGFEGDPARAPDGRIVLRQAMTPAELAARLHLSDAQADATVARCRAAMLAARDRRLRPQVDTAVLTDRNALMVSAYLAAGDALDDPEFTQAALGVLDFLLARSRAPDGTFCHAFREGKAAVPGLVADQVYMMQALIEAYEASGKRDYLDQASSLARLILNGYRDPASGLLVDRPQMPAGTVLAHAPPSPGVVYDDPMPSVQAALAEALHRLASLTSDPSLGSDAAKLLEPAVSMAGSAAGPSEGELGLAIEQRTHGEVVVAIAGPGDNPRTQELLLAARKTYRPGKVIMPLDPATRWAASLPEVMRAMYAASAKRDVPLGFVCAGTACANPVSTAPALVETIRRFGLAATQTGASAKRESPADPGALPPN